MAQTKEPRSYKDLGNVPLIFQAEEVLDRVIELHGQFKSRWYIRDILTDELEQEKPVSIIIIGILIGRAKLKIREQLKNGDPIDNKARIIQFLEILLGGKAKNRDKLKALEMLALYTGVDQQVQETPSDYARRVCEFMKQADISVGGIPGLEMQIERLKKELEQKKLEETTNESPEQQNKKAEGTGQKECEGTSQAQEAGS